MIRSPFSVLAASLLALAAGACRNSPTTGNEQPDMSEDMATAEQPDLTMPAPPADFSVPPPDLTGADLTPPPPPPPPTEFMVLRVGDGAATLSSASAAAFIERYKVSDGTAVGAPLPLPTAVSGANRRLTIGGSTNSEGALSRSGDGKYVLVGGYDAAVGTAAVAATKSVDTNRVIGRIDKDGNIDTTTAGDFFSGANLRTVASTDGMSLWAGSNAQLVYLTFGPVTQTTPIVSLNVRNAHVFGGQLYASSSSNPYKGINSVGAGTPTAAATAKLLSGFETQTATSHYGFVGIDSDGMPGFETLYVADDSATTAGGGVQRWTRSGTTWSYDGVFNKGLTAGARGLAGYQTETGAVLIAATAETQNRLVKFIDDKVAKDKIKDVDAIELAKAGDKTAYRGVALSPN